MRNLSTEDFIAEITLGNASLPEIKDYIRHQAKELRRLQAKLDMIDLRDKQRQLNRKRASLRRFIERNTS